MFVVALISVFGRSSQEPARNAAAVYPVSILWRSRVLYPETPHRKGFIVDVDEDTHVKRDFPEDHFVLQILSAQSSREPIARITFDSTYGEFNLALVDVTGDGTEEFFLITGEGRGTNARFETLTVLKRDGASLHPILKTRVSAPCGVDCRWQYEPHFENTGQSGRINLRLTRKIIGTVGQDDHKLIPKEEEKEFAYSAADGKMIQIGSGH